MENKNEILVGALTILGIAAFIIGFKFLQGDNLFSRSKFVYIVADRVPGITPSSPVLENDVPIGRVENVSISTSPNFPYKALLKLKLDNNVEIPKDSKFIIYGLDMLGKMGIGLVRGESNDLASLKDTLSCLVKGNSIEQGVDLVAQLKPKIDSLLGSFTALSNNLNTQLGSGENSLLKKAVGDLSTTLVSVNKLAGNADKMITTLNGTLADNRANIDGILSNVNRLTSESGKLDSILTNFQTFSGKIASLDLASTLESAKGTLEQLKKTLALINDGDGSISKLLKEDGAYNDIVKTINSLNAVLTDLKANPKKYISLSLIDRTKTYTFTDTSVQQFLENNPKAAKKIKK
ncbi:MAG TPA: MlaD family protein [Chitinophagales bacterium]|nr:MCE family protein [Chitinophagales bacterium]MBP6154881.1 MCE family protein [Chitinophagales bacterium]HQV78573.1 MlaD family protein [Chitinophagales bacterium]HQW79041.1 MlaD family protein [Chitinophagales bacterium]